MRDAKWPELTTKQADFVRAFLANGGNATEAAVSAGYSQRTAKSVGHENLTKPDIRQRVDDERRKLARSAEITAEEVAMRLAWLARSDPADFYEVGPRGVTVKDTSQLSEAQRYALREAAQTVSDSGGSIKIKIADPKPALDTLAKWLGMLVTKHEHTGKDGGPIETRADLSKLSAEQLRNLVDIRKALDAEDEDG